MRLAWITSHTEIGWETISQQWRDATVGLVVGEYQYLTYHEPVEQAAFWLAETDRIVAEDPKNPELLMGAALLLAEPGMGFELRHMRFTSTSFPDFITMPRPRHRRFRESMSPQVSRTGQKGNGTATQ